MNGELLRGTAASKGSSVRQTSAQTRAGNKDLRVQKILAKGVREGPGKEGSPCGAHY